MAQTELLVSKLGIVVSIGSETNTMSRPKEFARFTYEDDEDEDSTVGKMPPSDSEDEN